MTIIPAKKNTLSPRKRRLWLGRLDLAGGGSGDRETAVDGQGQRRLGLASEGTGQGSAERQVQWREKAF